MSVQTSLKEGADSPEEDNMQEHYVTALATSDRETSVGCRCGWVTWVSNYSYKGAFETHVKEAKEAEEKAASEPMPRRVEMADLLALAERMSANADYIFGKGEVSK